MFDEHVPLVHTATGRHNHPSKSDSKDLFEARKEQESVRVSSY